MSQPAPRPSYLQLDRAFVAQGRPSGSGFGAHAYVARHLARLGASPTLPRWTDALHHEPPLGGRPRAAALALAVLLAAGALIAGHAEPRELFGAQPKVSLQIVRGARTFAWDGQSPLEPDDALRLRISAPGFHQARVLGLTARAQHALQPATLTDAGDAELPLVLEHRPVDGRRRLRVVLERRPSSEADLARDAPARALRRDDVSVDVDLPAAR